MTSCASIQWSTIHPVVHLSIHPNKVQTDSNSDVCSNVGSYFTTPKVQLSDDFLHSPQTNACKADLTYHYGLSPNTPPHLHLKERGNYFKTFLNIYNWFGPFLFLGKALYKNNKNWATGPVLTSVKEEKHAILPTTLNFAVRRGKLRIYTLPYPPDVF